MANPIMDWLRGNDLSRPKQIPLKVTPFTTGPLGQIQTNIKEEKLYLYPDRLAPGLAADPDIYAAIRLGTLVHGPGATEMYYRAWHHEDSNSAVFACLQRICTAATEAKLTVFRQTEPGKRDPLPEHPMQAFLERPNPSLSMRELEYYKRWCKLVNGNAYFRKIRSSAGGLVQMWPLSPLRVVPVTTKEDAARGVFISYYAYKYDPAKDPELIPVEDMLHFRHGIDDKDHRVGVAPLAKIARETLGDDLATEWQAMMLQNGGTAGMLVQVPPETNLSEDQAEVLKSKMEERFGGRNRGRVGILTGGAEAKPYGFSPEQMDMRTLHRTPEERISAVLGVAAVIVGLGAGLERSIYNNWREAREDFTESLLLPMYAFEADTLNLQLKPEFTNDPNITIDYDTTTMRALQEDMDAKYVRVVSAWNANLITLNQALSELGFPPEADGDKRKNEIGMEMAQEMGPPPGQEQDGPPRPGEERSRGVPQTKARKADMPDVLQAIVDIATPAMKQEVENFYDEQRKRVKRRLVG